MSSPLNPRLLLTLLVFSAVFLAPPLRVPMPAGLCWPGLLLACVGHLKKEKSVCLCVFLHVCFYSVSPCKGRKARPPKWLRPFDRGQRFCLVSLRGWRVGEAGHSLQRVRFFFAWWRRFIMPVFLFYFILVNVLMSATVFLLQTKLNYLSHLFYQWKCKTTLNIRDKVFCWVSTFHRIFVLMSLHKVGCIKKLEKNTTM